MSLLLLAILIAAFLFLGANKPKTRDQVNKDAQEIYRLLLLNGISPEIAAYATAQAAFETGGFSSKIYDKNKNAFGYKYVGQDIAEGEQYGHAKYKTVADSVVDWVGYWNRRRLRMPVPFVFNSLKDFVHYLKRDIDPGPYFEADEVKYLNGVTVHYNSMFV